MSRKTGRSKCEYMWQLREHEERSSWLLFGKAGEKKKAVPGMA